MIPSRPSIFYIFLSRKFWTMIGAVITLLVAASNQDPYPIETVIQGIVAIVLGYIGTTAWEDVAMKKALTTPTTTIETPSENVRVSTSENTPPTLGTMG